MSIGSAQLLPTICLHIMSTVLTEHKPNADAVDSKLPIFSARMLEDRRHLAIWVTYIINYL